MAMTSCANKMPFQVSAEDVFEPVLHYDRDLNSAHYRKQPLDETSAEDILLLLYGSEEIEKSKTAPRNEYVSLDIHGGGIIAIHPAEDGEHIFFRRDNKSYYKAKNPQLAEYIANQLSIIREDIS